MKWCMKCNTYTVITVDTDVKEDLLPKIGFTFCSCVSTRQGTVQVDLSSKLELIHISTSNI